MVTQNSTPTHTAHHTTHYIVQEFSCIHPGSLSLNDARVDTRYIVLQHLLQKALLKRLHSHPANRNF